MNSIFLALRGRGACVLVLCAVIAATIVPSVRAEAVPAGSPTWLEPKGLNIVDLVGRVPESELKGLVLQYASGFGIVRYESGTRSGDQVIVVAKASTRYYKQGSWYGTLFGCLGQAAYYDQIASASPATRLRISANDKDVTREVTSVAYMASGVRGPSLTSAQSIRQGPPRYPKTSGKPSLNANGEIVLPANTGCELIIPYRNYPELLLTFTANVPEKLDVTVVGSATFTYHSYLGPGHAGTVAPLVRQLQDAGYKFRHEKFEMHPPAGADYFLLNYPAAPVDPYVEFSDENAGRAASGTYRVVIPSGLSVDHVNAMGLPLYGQWQDIDQAEAPWLAYSGEPLQIAAPEYFVPSSISFDPCMTRGNCPADLLHRIYSTPMTMKLLYLRVQPVRGNFQRYPVQIPGTAPASGSASVPPAWARTRLYIPIVSLEMPATVSDDAADCSPRGGCGWFTPDGRMIDYIPYP